MKQQKTIWYIGLCLLGLAALTAYFYGNVYLAWNVPLYALAMAAIFLDGAAAFALLAKAKEKPKKRVLLSALLLGEPLTVLSMIGVVLVIGGAIVSELE